MSSATAGEPLTDLARAASPLVQDAAVDLAAHAGATPPSASVELPDAPPTASWLAAYAMGLVASEQHLDGVQELLSCLPDDDAPVEEAIARLDDPQVGDAELRGRARRLLERARASMTAIRTPRHA